MKRWQLMLAGLGLFLLAVVMTVPAALLRRVLPPALEIGRFEGTLWQGSVSQVGWKGQAVLDGLQWDWKTSRLLTLSLVFDLRSRWQGQEGRARVEAGLSSVSLRDAGFVVPLEPFAAQIPQLASYRLRGNLNLQTQEFSWSGERGSGELVAEWRNARSDYSGDAVMGSYRIQLKAADKGYAVKVATQEGMLRISADGSGRPGQGWNAGAVIEAPPDQMPQFQSLLGRIGPPNPDGKYVLRYSFK